MPGDDRHEATVQLIDAQNGSDVWAGRFETDRRDLAQAHAEITGRLARTLHLELLDATDRRVGGAAANPDAEDLVNQGRALWFRPFSRAMHAEATRAFAQALKLDPRSAKARVGTR